MLVSAPFNPLKHNAELHHHSVSTKRFPVTSCLTDGQALIHIPTNLSRGQAVKGLTNIISVKYFLFKFCHAIHTAAQGICMNLDKD